MILVTRQKLVEILEGQNQWKSHIFAWFSKFSFAGLGALWVRQALFSKIFEKFENFRMLSKPWSFPLDKYLLTYWKVKVSENAIFLRDFQNLHLQVWVRCGCAKPFFQKFLKSSKILEYFPYLDHFHSTKTRWHIGRSKSVKNPYFWEGGSFYDFERFWWPGIGVPWYIVQDEVAYIVIITQNILWDFGKLKTFW